MLTYLILGIQSFMVIYGVYTFFNARYWHWPNKEIVGNHARIAGGICLLILPFMVILNLSEARFDPASLNRINILGTFFIAYGSFGMGRAFYRGRYEK